MFKKHLLTAFGAVSLALTASMALADDVASYPDRQVRMIVPFPPGGSVDYIARIVVPEFAKQLGETVYIENKGGASASIGTAELARSKPDGYTLQFIFDTHAVNPHIMDNLSYDTFEDFEYITGITSAPMVLATSPSFEIDNLPDFIEYAKENPDEITYGSSGVGGSNHLTALNFSQMADISTLHVPYTGGGPMLTALMRGEVDFVVTTFPLVLERIKGGQMNAIAIGSNERVPQLDVPTIEEYLPGYEARSWIGLVAPKGTPEGVLDKIHTAMSAAMDSPAVKDRLESEGWDIMISSPEEFKEWVVAKYEEAERLVESGGIEVDN